MFRALGQKHWVDALGIAAPQIGIFKRAFIFTNKKGEKEVVINPTVMAKKGNKWLRGEGCLSIPNFKSDIKRYSFFKIQAYDENDKGITIKANGMESFQLQHEIDHLNGVLFIDHLPKSHKGLKEYKKSVEEKMVKLDPHSATL